MAQEIAFNEAEPQYQTVERVHVPKAADLVVHRIRRQIARGELQVGQLLPPEPELLRQLGVGRPALREAMRVLETEGLIRILRGNKGGSVVQAPTIATAVRAAGLYLQTNGTTIDDVYEARLIIEPAAAHRAARLADESGIARLRQLLDEEEAIREDPVGWAHAAVRFHEAIVDLAGLETLSLFAGMLSEIIDRHQVTQVSRPDGDPIDNRHHADRAHEKLLLLIEQHDEDGAEALWRSHVSETNTRYAKTGAGMPVIDLFE